MVPGVSAQADDRIALASFDELTVPISPRAIALGQSLSAGLENHSALDAFNRNPAALSLNTSTRVHAVRTSYVTSGQNLGFNPRFVNHLSVAQSFGESNVAIQLTNWRWNDVSSDCNVDGDPQTTESCTWSRKIFAVGGTYAQQLNSELAVGLTLKGMSLNENSKAQSETDFELTSNAIAVDGGVTWAIPRSNFRLGLSIQNLGVTSSEIIEEDSPVGPQGPFEPGTQFEENSAEGYLPIAIGASGSYTEQLSNDLLVSVLGSFQVYPGVRNTSENITGLGAGLETSFKNLIYLRGGINTIANSDNSSIWSRGPIWSAGIGLNIPIDQVKVGLDYAYRPGEDFDSAHVFSLGIGL